ncbi:hypothetical protein ACQKDD_00160 [Planococcus kocurii]|uniref:Uncharacterized protein n=1 Tax=Planococcus kocurii TaxID=1374 RepID=A0ABM5WXT1_9BACL|nr:hypothetical protein [Planococcus kocurii]ALS79158.1 hypothetical protein AUO94_10995 [Planococcus kocurii]
MKKDIFSIIVILAFIGFLVATFFLQYEYFFLTRFVSLIFAVVYLVIELKKEYFSSHKPLYILFSVVSMLALTVSILLDKTFGTDEFNARIFYCLIFMFCLLVISYRDLYEKNNGAK